ncbi:MAG: DUF6600 domain-containing protein [Myxococcaceae bacterium]
MEARLIRGLLVASVVAVSLFAAPEAKAWGGTEVSVSFGTALSPYGEWVSVSRVGRVWRPYRSVVGAEFVPYETGGHWVNSDYGWMFVSDYEWGWAPFHYGRWFMDPIYGWVWVPDSVWGPAWVDWRYGGGYVGWAPLAPAAFAVSYWHPHYCFVETRYFTEPNFYRYRVPDYRVPQVHAATAVVPPRQYGNTRYYAGPPATQVAHDAGHPVSQVQVSRPPPGRVGVTEFRGETHQLQPGGQTRGMTQDNSGRAHFNSGPPGRVENGNGSAARQNPEDGWNQFPGQRGEPHPRNGSNQLNQSSAFPQHSEPVERFGQQQVTPPQPWRQGEERPATGGRVDSVPHEMHQLGQQPQQREQMNPAPQFQRHDSFGAPQQFEQPQVQQREQMNPAPQLQRHDSFGAPQQFQAPHQFQGGQTYQAPQYHQTQRMEAPQQYRQMPPQQFQRMEAPQMPPQMQQRPPQQFHQAPQAQPGMRGGASFHHR